MSNPTRPIAFQQWQGIGTCRLAEVPGNPQVRIIATASDQMTDRRFYVVQGDGPCFGIWPEEATDVCYSQAVPRKAQFYLGT